MAEEDCVDQNEQWVPNATDDSEEFYGILDFINFNCENKFARETVKLEQNTRTCNRMLRYNIVQYYF
jgi:hypothetical protein